MNPMKLQPGDYVLTQPLVRRDSEYARIADVFLQAGVARGEFPSTEVYDEPRFGWNEHTDALFHGNGTVSLLGRDRTQELRRFICGPETPWVPSPDTRCRFRFLGQEWGNRTCTVLGYHNGMVWVQRDDRRCSELQPVQNIRFKQLSQEQAIAAA